MKKTLLLLLLSVAFSAHGQHIKTIPASIDPHRYDFAPYWNSILSVESTSISGRSKYEMFGSDASDMDCLKDSVCFVLKPGYYKIWIPEIATLFTVKPINNKPISLGNHFLMLLQMLRDYKNFNIHATN